MPGDQMLGPRGSIKIKYKYQYVKKYILVAGKAAVSGDVKYQGERQSIDAKVWGGTRVVVK